MNKRTGIRGLCGVALLGLMPLSAHAQDDQPKEVPAQWCQVDDPAAWRLAREALIAQDERDLSNIPCPAKETGADLPLQLTLPMPCGRSFVFRRIDVPVSHALDQVAGSFGRSVDIAVETPQTVLSNGPWIQPVGGVFSVNQDGKQAATDQLDNLSARAYYVGKYELLDLQWQLFTLGLLDVPPAETADPKSGACAPFQAVLEDSNLRRVRPKGGLSWFDAVDFSRAYTNWLLKFDAARRADGKEPVMPWEQGATSYVRLPTEAEWEYAARGGASFVTPQSRSLRLPMVVKPDTGEAVQAELQDVCIEPPRDPDFKVSAVGRTQANTLGLYDVVCNAEELVLDLFRITRPDGLGGQVGGIITKGGNSILLREQNTVGRRSEAQALFNTLGEARTSTVGVRLAISAPVFVGRRDENTDFVEGRPNQAFEAAMMAGRKVLLDSGVGLNDENDSGELEAQVNKLRREISEGKLTQSELQDRATQLQVELDRLNVRLRQSTTDEVLLSIRSAIITANLIDRIGRNMFAGMDRIDDLRKQKDQTDEIRASVAKGQADLIKNRTRIAASFDLYLQVQGELAQLEEAFVNRQILDTRRGLGGTNTEVFGQYLAFFEQHHKEIRNNRGRVTETMRKSWLDDLDPAHQMRRQVFGDQEPPR